MQKKKICKGRHGSTRRGILLDDDDANGDLGNFQTEPKTIHDYFKQFSEKKASVRKEAISLILKALTDNIEHKFVEQNFVTLVYQCLQCFKKGSDMDIQQAAHVIGLLAMITSSADKLHEAYEDVLTVFSQGLKSKLKTLKIFDCLAVVTFFGASNSDETEEAMQLLWNFIHSTSDSSAHSPAVLTAAISAWSFLLSSIDGWMLSYKKWQGAISYFSNLVDNNDETVSAAASEALALIFETNCLEKFSDQAKDSHGSIHEGVTSIKIHSKKELKDNIIEQLRSRFAETRNENIPTKDTRTGLNAVLAALNFLEEDDCLNEYLRDNWWAETHIINMVSDDTAKVFEAIPRKRWICQAYEGLNAPLFTPNFFMTFLLYSTYLFDKQENENFHYVFEFMPKTKNPSGRTLYIPEREEVIVRFRPPVPRHQDCSLLPFISREERQLQKKMTMSPNSHLSKARTQLVKKLRRLSLEERENDCFAVADEFR
ncbi:hypothetical protein REPUB_Repub01dG0198400 [Reevesia pubescens]